MSRRFSLKDMPSRNQELEVERLRIERTRGWVQAALPLSLLLVVGWTALSEGWRLPWIVIFAAGAFMFMWSVFHLVRVYRQLTAVSSTTLDDQVPLSDRDVIEVGTWLYANTLDARFREITAKRGPPTYVTLNGYIYDIQAFAVPARFRADLGF